MYLVFLNRLQFTNYPRFFIDYDLLAEIVDRKVLLQNVVFNKWTNPRSDYTIHDVVFVQAILQMMSKTIVSVKMRRKVRVYTAKVKVSI